jgi:hypothetical protein
MSDPIFIPGLELSEALYADAVQPILAQFRPDMRYAAARLGSGSEVLGFDSARSTDHEWGPRLDIFLERDQAEAAGDTIRALLAERLPKQIRGWPTNFRESIDPLDPVGHMELSEGRVNHRIGVYHLAGWAHEQLRLGPSLQPTTLDWLAMPQQRLAEVTGGRVYRDDLGGLTEVRARLAWYPDQVWRYLLACQWQRISQQEAFPGRCSEAGDELGSAIVTARLARDLMRLCLLLARRYAPYDKWLGTAFAQLPVAGELAPHLRDALAATGYEMREERLCAAFEIAGELQNRSGLANDVDPNCRGYHGRPYRVLHAERFAQALRRTISDTQLRSLPLTGGVDQWADSTDLSFQPEAIRDALKALLHSKA